MSGSVAYHSGFAAEEAVARHYEGTGHRIAQRRWRSGAGEIDLVARKDGEVIFIEVKRAKNLSAAAESLSSGQFRRITRAAEVFLGQEPAGRDSPARIDVALVDGIGQIDIIENACAA